MDERAVDSSTKNTPMTARAAECHGVSMSEERAENNIGMWESKKDSSSDGSYARNKRRIFPGGVLSGDSTGDEGVVEVRGLVNGRVVRKAKSMNPTTATTRRKPASLARQLDPVGTVFAEGAFDDDRRGRRPGVSSDIPPPIPRATQGGD